MVDPRNINLPTTSGLLPTTKKRCRCSYCSSRKGNSGTGTGQLLPLQPLLKGIVSHMEVGQLLPLCTTQSEPQQPQLLLLTC